MSAPEHDTVEVVGAIARALCDASGGGCVCPINGRSDFCNTPTKLAKVALTALESLGYVRGKEGWQLVPKEPTEEMWGGLARQIVFWMRSTSAPHTGASMYRWLEPVGIKAPEWLLKEIPDDDRVPPKGTMAAVIYKAMLSAAPSLTQGEG